MVKKIFTYRGKTIEELQKMSIEDFMKLLPSKERRSLKRGFNEEQKVLVKRVENNEQNIKTHSRETIILPSMVGKTIKVYNGKEFFPILIQSEMIGHRLGQFSLTRKIVKHNAPGIG